MEKTNRQTVAGRRSAQGHRQMQQPSRAARKERVRIEENGYRAPNRLMQKLKAINWCKAVLCVVAVYAIFSIGSKVITISAQKAKQEELLQRQIVLEQQVKDLQKEKAYVGSDEYIEQAAREKFGWVKEGEIVFKEKNAAE